ncbi:MAG: 3-deoxy-D-manno-octulosonic acid transferase [Chlamydiae bacterium]|nr:3-deoxy-D-manno-octulosonic acid transferase [Chlamydiota bacterium]
MAKHGKYKSTLKNRFGLDLPKRKENKGKTIWIHAVSVGETNAIEPLFKKIKQTYPDVQIFISSTTETGNSEAKRILPNADGYFFLPLDFSWLMKRAVKQLRPDLLLLSESDYWYQMARSVRKKSGKVAIINGKISLDSMERFCKFSLFTKNLFEQIDQLFLQSDRQLVRFLKMGIDPGKLRVIGNLKLDKEPLSLAAEEIALLKKEVGIQAKDRVIVIGSTHEPEEELLLSSLKPLWKEIPECKILLVPRHPERFSHVAKVVEKNGLKSISYSNAKNKTGKEEVILIDQMGLLKHCFLLSEIAIIGGSFIPDVGGHNVFEPILHGIPVIFGPHMQSQLDIAEQILSHKAGLQLPITDLSKKVLYLLQNSYEIEKLKQQGKSLISASKGSLERVFESLKLELG